MSEHTPGPWEAVHEIDPRDDRLVGERWNIRVRDTRGTRSIAVTQGTQNPMLWASNEANARLMAAAPDLLEALEYVLDWRPDGWSAETARAMARTAIAKAKGKDNG